MFSLPLCVFLAVSSFGSGSSNTAPTPPLQGPPAPQQSVSPTTTQPRRPPSQQMPFRDILEQKQRERDFESSAQGPLYIYPGVVRAKEGNWVGFDYLYNIGNNIPVEVTIVKPGEASIPISEESIKQRIIEEFQKANIDTTINSVGGQPPSAIFSMMILIYPVNDGFIALCDGRLLETITVKRVTPSPSEGIFQAITWEHKNLIVAPTDNFVLLMTQTVDTIARTFIERYSFFESFRKKQEGGVVQ